MAEAQALLLGGPCHGTVQPDPATPELTSNAHLYDRTNQVADEGNAELVIYRHRLDCCDAHGGADDECE